MASMDADEDHPTAMGLPSCVTGCSPPHPYQLMWSLPLMLTCPVHHCLLESHEGARGYHFGWYDQLPTPRTADAAIRDMDARTWHALTTGGVNLPRRRVHAGVWIRLLPTLLGELDELGATLTESGAA